MNAVEFQTDIKDGTIEIPVEYRDRVKGTVRVIVLSAEQSRPADMIDRLLAEPLKADRFRPLSRDEIYRE
jgi:hypothetical protein